MTFINNMPSYYIDYEYIAYTSNRGDRWFYGAYTTIEEANKAARQIGGYIAHTSEVLPM